MVKVRIKDSLVHFLFFHNLTGNESEDMIVPDDIEITLSWIPYHLLTIRRRGSRGQERKGFFLSAADERIIG